MAKTKASKNVKFTEAWPKFKCLHKSQILTAKNGNKYEILVIEIQVGDKTQIQNIAFFLD